MLLHTLFLYAMAFFGLRDSLYNSSLSVVWAGSLLLLARTIQDAMGNRRSNPPEVAGMARNLREMFWSCGKRVASLQKARVDASPSSKGSERYMSSSDTFMVLAAGCKKLNIFLRLMLPFSELVASWSWSSASRFTSCSIFMLHVSSSLISDSTRLRTRALEGAVRVASSPSNFASPKG